MPLSLGVGTTVSGRYVISQFIGQGGYSQVWRATDKELGREVAIKRMLHSGGEDEQFAHAEAQRIRQLAGHKNIVELYDTISEEETLLVMEFVRGENMAELLQRHVREKTWIQTEEALDYIRQLLEGLLFAHSHFLFHRDIKPSNLLISDLGVLKIVDFGLAKGVKELGPEDLKTQMAARSGTVAFMSPEAAVGKSQDQRTDIFSAGIVCYLLLTGKHPFCHHSGVFSMYDLIKDPNYQCEEMDKVKGVPDALRRSIMSMLSKDIETRCGSLHRVLNEMETTLTCPRCGGANQRSNKYCGACGIELRSAVSAPTDGDSASQLTDRGFLLTQQDKWDDSIELYKRAIAKDPKFARAHSNLAFSLVKLGKYQEAITTASAGIACASEFRDFHRLYDVRGVARHSLKQYDLAIEDFGASIRYIDGNPRVYYHRAESLAALEDFSAALSDVERALRIDDSFWPATRLRDRLAFRMR